ncbi:hypothetical protein NDU88_002318, partial [Pleurodeles waltl]
VVDLYWGTDPEEWDSPDLQRTRMRLLEECLRTSAGPCFVGGNHGCFMEIASSTKMCIVRL